MQLTEIVQRYGLGDRLLGILKQNGISKLYPPQEEALVAGLKEEKNLVLSMPTASGKTLVAEFLILREILAKRGKCLYSVPLRALASEKYHDFKSKYRSLGVRVGIATSDYDEPSSYLAKYSLLIATQEKIDSLLRFGSTWLVENLSLVVIDEIHYLDDSSRGPTLEILISRLRQINPKIKIVALSATISNAEEIAGWLNAHLIKSDFRPVPLKEGVFYLKKIRFFDGSLFSLPYDKPSELINLTMDTLMDKGQVLIFVNNRRSTQAVAKNLAKELSHFINNKKVLEKIAAKIDGDRAESTKIGRLLSWCVKSGVAFHHAGLKASQRNIIEDAFRKNLIKVISSTPTLSAGVNLPAKRVIMRDYKRYEAGFGSQPIPIFEYKQCAGRAGRPQYDKFGESILIAQSISESMELFDGYINAPPEPIMSRLANRVSLRMHILAAIAAGYAKDQDRLMDFFGLTFFAHQKTANSLAYLIDDILQFLNNSGMIRPQRYGFKATALGNCITRLYLDPLSGFNLKENLPKVALKRKKTLAILEAICRCPDMEILKLRSRDPEGMHKFIALHKEELLFDDTPEGEDYLDYLAQIKTVCMLNEWIDEKREDQICDDFNIGPGDIYRHINIAEWLVYSASVISKVLGVLNIGKELESLRTRIKYGIKKELLELASLKNVGRIRARGLFSAGYRNLRDVDKASEKSLAKIPQIGNKLAKDIKLEVSTLI